DPSRMAVMGASSGGLVVLNFLASYPDMCAAGVDLYGVTDLQDLASVTYRYEAHYMDGMVGPLPNAADLYRARSPISRADAIREPLLVLHGSADKVVPAAQSAALVDALRRGGAVVEHHVYPDEGHGWSQPATRADELDRIEDFLNRHVLNGEL
ncbi:MAG: alpha/beta hydrolase family protein, partial [Acidimicrobiales bacterium]